jgi:hypothetical protein
MATETQTLNLAREIRLLLQIALAVFIYTVVIGILNGTDLVDFEHKTLLTHVHAGTLGWITLSVMAGAFWLFAHDQPGPESHASLARVLAYATPVLVVAYVIAFLSTTGMVRPILGATVGGMLTVFLVWVAIRSRYVGRLTVPHVAFLAAAATSVTGAVFGVLLGLQLATGNQFLPEDGEAAHPATMVIGFLIPVGMALAELGMRGRANLPAAGRLGTAQIAFPFVGGILVALGILLDLIPLIALSLPFEIIGVVILLKRLWPELSRTVSASTPHRHGAFSVLFLVINITFFVFLVVNYAGDFDLVPTRLILALDHMMFIGVITNGVLALAYLVTQARAGVMSWADNVVLLGMNLGLVLFVLGLMADVTVLKQIGTPIMGFSILLAVAVYTLRLNIWETADAEIEGARV